MKIGYVKDALQLRKAGQMMGKKGTKSAPFWGLTRRLKKSFLFRGPCE
jgi:hypothetical protein